MKLSGNNSSVPLLVALVAALLFAIFYYVVLPKKEDVKSLESSVGSLQTEIQTLQAEITTLEAEGSNQVSNVFEIRQKLPQSREIDQLLLNLEEIQYVTQTRITSIGFNSYDALVSESAIVPAPVEGDTTTDGETATNTGENGETTENVEGEETGETVETPVSEIAAQTLPPELKLITFNLEIEASNNRNIQQLIEEIENLKRIMHIDSISYSLPGEEGQFTEDDETLNASIQVTTFYYEGEK